MDASEHVQAAAEQARQQINTQQPANAASAAASNPLPTAARTGSASPNASHQSNTCWDESTNMLGTTMLPVRRTVLLQDMVNKNAPATRKAPAPTAAAVNRPAPIKPRLQSLSRSASEDSQSHRGTHSHQSSTTGDREQSKNDGQRAQHTQGCVQVVPVGDVATNCSVSSNEEENLEGRMLVPDVGVEGEGADTRVFHDAQRYLSQLQRWLMSTCSVTLCPGWRVSISYPTCTSAEPAKATAVAGKAKPAITVSPPAAHTPSQADATVLSSPAAAAAGPTNAAAELKTEPVNATAAGEGPANATIAEPKTTATAAAAAAAAAEPTPAQAAAPTALVLYGSPHVSFISPTGAQCNSFAQVAQVLGLQQPQQPTQQQHAQQQQLVKRESAQPPHSYVNPTPPHQQHTQMGAQNIAHHAQHTVSLLSNNNINTPSLGAAHATEAAGTVHATCNAQAIGNAQATGADVPTPSTLFDGTANTAPTAFIAGTAQAAANTTQAAAGKAVVCVPKTKCLSELAESGEQKKETEGGAGDPHTTLSSHKSEAEKKERKRSEGGGNEREGVGVLAGAACALLGGQNEGQNKEQVADEHSTLNSLDSKELQKGQRKPRKPRKDTKEEALTTFARWAQIGPHARKRSLKPSNQAQAANKRVCVYRTRPCHDTSLVPPKRSAEEVLKELMQSRKSDKQLSSNVLLRQLQLKQLTQQPQQQLQQLQQPQPQQGLQLPQMSVQQPQQALQPTQLPQMPLTAPAAASGLPPGYRVMQASQDLQQQHLYQQQQQMQMQMPQAQMQFVQQPQVFSALSAPLQQHMLPVLSAPMQQQHLALSAPMQQQHMHPVLSAPMQQQQLFQLQQQQLPNPHFVMHPQQQL